MSCIVDNGLLQLFNEPTRIATATVLDLLIVNDPYFVYNVSVITLFSTIVITMLSHRVVGFRALLCY